MRPLVVLVEDRDADYEMFARRIMHAGRQVEFLRFHGVSDSLAWVAGYRGDGLRLLVLDFRLLDGDACEILGVLARRPDLRGVAVVIWSASVDPAVPARCDALGASEFLEKPTDARTAAIVIDSLLEARLTPFAHHGPS